ncbi:MAG: DUF359 domain-containing protein [Crenarchaeota archaeon]|nr:DUF359 domain-containing protein [Thermoproteota archaeon]
MVTARAWSLGLRPLLAVYDCATHRSRATCPEPPEGYRVLRVVNPASTITPGLSSAIESALRTRVETAVLVEGEEDLAVLPAIIAAPRDTLIVYGQPYLGVVSLHVDDLARWQALVLAASMEEAVEAPGGKT